MANRVLLNSEGLKISRPGINVLTATDAQLYFSSDWSQPTFWMRGQISIAAGQTRTVSFGKTFAKQPFVAGTVGGNLVFPTAGTWLGWVYNSMAGMDFPLTAIQVFTDRMVLNGDALVTGGYGSVVNYAIMDYRT